MLLSVLAGEALQLDALSPSTATPVFSDEASGKLESGPALDYLLGEARPGQAGWYGDVIGQSCVLGASASGGVGVVRQGEAVTAGRGLDGTDGLVGLVKGAGVAVLEFADPVADGGLQVS